MEKYKKILKLNLPEYDYTIIKKNNRLFITDLLKGKQLVLTPEEWVRQHYINYLISVKKIPRNLIAAESGLKYHRLGKRVDIIVYSTNGKVLLLAECKAAYVRIDKNTVFQLSVYNSRVNSPFLSVTNGMEHHCWQNSGDGNFIKLPELPEFSVMNNFTV